MRKGIRSLTGHNAGGSVNLPPPNPAPIPPPVVVPPTQQTVSMAATILAPSVFSPGITRVSPTQNVSMSFVTTSQTALSPSVTGGAGALMTFAQYQAYVLAQMKGYAYFATVTGAQGATAPTVVTNTNDSGTGSLRAALSGSNRWIIFDKTVFPRNTEVTINTTSYISPRNINNITIDGFGSQVKIAGWGIDWSDWQPPPAGPTNICNNICVLNLKIVQAGTSNDGCLVFDGPDRIWVYHCDNSGAGDGNLRIANSVNGPNANGYSTIQNCYLHDSAGAEAGKDVLLGDETEDYTDYNQASSSYTGAGGANGGDHRITFVDCHFKDQLRNPVSFNYWIHLYNNYVHGWVYEGTAAFGGLTNQRINNSVYDGTGAGANAYKGIYASYWGLYADHTREYKRVLESGNVFLGGATFADESSGTLNPAGSIFTVPYSYTPETVTGDSGAALIARLASTSTATQGRAGVIVTDGYYAKVLGTP